MYSYTHDPESGGLLLNDQPAQFSKEPRPVYASELVLLGFDEFWNFERQDNIPYMWAESNFYWYKGRRVAQIKGGNLFEKPAVILEIGENSEQILPIGTYLEPINIKLMIKKNLLLLSTIERTTKKRLYHYYSKNKNKFDCFRISFSGGKDSTVLLYLVKACIPSENLIVLFGDTGMEFPDTYNFIDNISKLCKQDNIPFYIARSHLKAEESWKIFGPPSRILRWCCSVHKAAPLVLKMREIMDHKKFYELVFVGVRRFESEARSHYTFLENNRKIQGQTTYNAILDWTSAEVWLYTFWKKLPVNNAYKYGNQRVGCLYCPMSLKTDYIKYKIYSKQTMPFIKITQEHFSCNDLINGYWSARTSGELLRDHEQKVFEEISDNFYYITIINPKHDINIWLKTIDISRIPVSIDIFIDKIILKIDLDFCNTNRKIISNLKNIAYKTAYCIGCKVCEANCPNNCIKFTNAIIIDNCTHCQSCNKLERGCMLHNSRRYPTMKDYKEIKTIDRYATHAPKAAWLNDFFKYGSDFFDKVQLGVEQKRRFKIFLRDVNLLDKDKISIFTTKLLSIGCMNKEALELLLINLAYSPQFQWFVKNLSIDMHYKREDCITKMYSQGYKDIASKNVIGSFKRFCALPVCSALQWCFCTTKGNTLDILGRTKPSSPDSRVLLYGLYKFAEACEGFYEVTLGRLMDFETESKGVSPAEIFALSRDEMSQYLRGLAQNYPGFVTNFASTHGLEILNLNPDKTSTDVLELF